MNGSAAKTWATDARFTLLVLTLVLGALLLGGCDCTAGSDAISSTMCKTDKPE